MRFEFLVSCHMMPYNDVEDVRQFLAGVLTATLDYSQIDFDDGMIQVRNKCAVSGAPADGDNTLIGFTLELPEDIANAESIVADFAKDLQNNPPVFHVVKFEDPVLRAELAERAGEIFALEMKLRRVLSFIYLPAHDLRDPFNLLREDQVQIPQKQRPTEEEMKDASENEFFHITFGQYINLNQRREIGPRHLVDIIRDSEHYDVLREEVMRSPIVNERDTELLGDLKELMNPIEQMRNCVAHNRMPNKKVKQDYSTTLPRLEERLDSYLARWGV